jgi:hypothetical protein
MQIEQRRAGRAQRHAGRDALEAARDEEPGGGVGKHEQHRRDHQRAESDEQNGSASDLV